MLKLTTTFGMGAARRWAYSKMESFSERQENRLRVSYLKFDQDICGMGQHRNVFAALPGIGPHKEEMVFVEAHMDSRCEDGCDTQCNTTIYFDTLVYVTKKIDTIYFLEPGTLYYLTAATIDSNDIESQFTNEAFNFFTTGLEEQAYLSDGGITLLQNRPNPFDEATTISVLVERPVRYQKAFIRVADTQGRELARYDIELRPGLSEILYGYEKHQYRLSVAEQINYLEYNLKGANEVKGGVLQKNNQHDPFPSFRP